MYQQYLICLMQLYEANGVGNFYSEQVVGDREAIQLEKYLSLEIVEATFDVGEDHMVFTGRELMMR